MKFHWTALVLGIGILAIACNTEKKCKYKPAAIFDKSLPHVTAYNYEQQGSQSLESVMLDRGVLLEVFQDICDQTRQEYRFTVQGNRQNLPDSLWIKEASRQMVYLSGLSEKQSALKAWGDVIEQRRADFQIGVDKEVEPGIMMRIDKTVAPEQSTLIVVLEQK